MLRVTRHCRLASAIAHKERHIPRRAPIPLPARWLVLLLALAAPAAARAQAAPATKPSASAPGALALVDAYMAAWNAHDAAKAASFMTEDVEYYAASTPAPQKGRANARQNVIQAFMSAAPDCVWTRTGAPVVGAD